MRKFRSERKAFLTISKTPSERALAKEVYASWFIFLSYSALVYESAILPPNRIPHFLLNANDKVIHATLYFLLFGAALWAFKNSRWIYSRVLPEKSALVYCAIMGIVTETSQIFVPGRSCDAADWTADVLGAVLASWPTRRLA